MFGRIYPGLGILGSLRGIAEPRLVFQNVSFEER
jgi:hypothetical protein